jgi:tetratricopeptide (TPR) repeat protein
MGVSQGNEGMGQTSEQSLKKAFELQQRSSDIERFYINGHYFNTIGDLDKAVDTYEQWHKAYPRESIPMNNLALIYGALGEFDKALASSLDEMRVDPNSIFSYQDLTDGYLNLNRLDEARSVAEQGLAKVPDAIGPHRQLMDIAYMRGDLAEVDRHVAWAKGKPEEMFLLINKSFYDFNAGKRKAAMRTLADGEAAAQKFGNPEFSAFISGLSAYTAGIIGDCSSAKELAIASIRQFPTADNVQPASIALAQCGESSKATQALEGLIKQRPSDTMLNVMCKPVVLAVTATRERKPDEAIRFLEPARRVELGVGPGAAPGLVIYTRGLAFLAKKDGANAALEFHKIIDRRNLYVASPSFSLSQLGLARSYVLLGDPAKAKTAYQDLLAAWKDADPDFLPFQEAKSEYAKLE